MTSGGHFHPFLGGCFERVSLNSWVADARLYLSPVVGVEDS
jgi:hypothetical protein